MLRKQRPAGDRHTLQNRNTRILTLSLAVALTRTLSFTLTLTRTLRLPLTPTLTLGQEQLSDSKH